MNLPFSQSNEIRFSPAPITRANIVTFIGYAKRIIPAASIVTVELVAESAAECHEILSERLQEAKTQFDKEESDFNATYRQPIEEELKTHEEDKRSLLCREGQLRQEAATEGAQLGIRLESGDVQSLGSAHDAIEANCPNEAEIRGITRTAKVRASVDWWLQVVASASPFFLALLTFMGMLAILSGTDIQAALQGKMAPLALAAALGVTFPSLIGAYLFGWIFASTKEDTTTALPTARSKLGVVCGGLVVALSTAFLAGIDVTAVQTLAAEMVKTTARQGSIQSTNGMTEVIGYAFMAVACGAKFWGGYCASIASFQDDVLEGARRIRLDELRIKASKVLRLVAEADMVAARLSEDQSRIDELLGQLNDLKFTDELPDNVVAEINEARNAWIGESARFWSIVAAHSNDESVYRTVGLPPKSPFAKFFRRGTRRPNPS